MGYELMVTPSPWHNGVDERENWTVMKSMRTIMLDHKIPRYLWAEAT